MSGLRLTARGRSDALPMLAALAGRYAISVPTAARTSPNYGFSATRVVTPASYAACTAITDAPE